MLCPKRLEGGLEGFKTVHSPSARATVAQRIKTNAKRKVTTQTSNIIFLTNKQTYNINALQKG